MGSKQQTKKKMYSATGIFKGFRKKIRRFQDVSDKSISETFIFQNTFIGCLMCIVFSSLFGYLWGKFSIFHRLVSITVSRKNSFFCEKLHSRAKSLEEARVNLIHSLTLFREWIPLKALLKAKSNVN